MVADRKKTLDADELDGIEPKAGKNKKISIEFPEDASSDVINETLRQLGNITHKIMRDKTSVDQMREKYRKEGKRRWKCRVNSLRPGMNHFEFVVPHPETDQPIPVQGRCGVIIEKGLTRYMINCLQYEHSYRTEEIPDMTQGDGMVLACKTVRVPHYSVDIFEEIENPAPLGSVRTRSKKSA